MDWRLHELPHQQAPPGDWFIWLLRMGRGSGKTRTAAEYVRSRVDSGEWRTVNIAGPTKGDVMDYMIQGTAESPGLMGVWPRHLRPVINEQKMRLICHNRAVIRYRSADEPQRFEGPQADGGWCDEVDAWKPKGMKPEVAWRTYELGIRLGKDPRIVATATPKRGKLVAWLSSRDSCVVTTGSTYDNPFLSEGFRRRLLPEIEGTHLARAMLYGELPDAVEGAWLHPELLEKLRVDAAPELVRTVVGVDPYGGGGDACGIHAAGKGVDGHGYLLANRTCKLGPEGWGRRVCETAQEFGATTVVVETNYGGDMAIAVVEKSAQALGIPLRVKKITASRAKHVRFEPVALMAERGELHPVGPMQALEDQFCGFTAEGYEGDSSPNDADAAVFALQELFPVSAGPSWGDLYAASEAS